MDSLTKGQRVVLGLLAGQSSALATPEVWQATVQQDRQRGVSLHGGLSTADDMLRALRGLGLVSSRRIKGAGNVLWWEITDAGRRALDDRAFAEWAVEQIKTTLTPRLTPRGMNFAVAVARERLGLSQAEPPHRGLKLQDRALILNAVNRYLTDATASR